MSFLQPSLSAKRPRQAETIDLRSPVYQRATKKQEFRVESGKLSQSNSQIKGYIILLHIIYKKDFVNPLFFIYIFQILEENLLGRSSLRQKRLHPEYKADKNDKLMVVPLTLLALQLLRKAFLC